MSQPNRNRHNDPHKPTPATRRFIDGVLPPNSRSRLNNGPPPQQHQQPPPAGVMQQRGGFPFFPDARGSGPSSTAPSPNLGLHSPRSAAANTASASLGYQGQQANSVGLGGHASAQPAAAGRPHGQGQPPTSRTPLPSHFLDRTSAAPVPISQSKLKTPQANSSSGGASKSSNSQGQGDSKKKKKTT
ncbi:hypothetical protein K466DRAFT_566642 [Polyporus arcularius HHB13444]|uniref:Uncharacterized protein n=1 Tax=Polyporus arcularius HHB13444 TaxID=1314778 RepID=A0A5C3P9V7_9APHY|nr:hypothetical protein K466DRAFT_566642 [Polyporus arcularius HHB13444]